MKADDVMRTLGISRNQLFHWTRDGRIRAVKDANGRYDYDRESVLALAGRESHRWIEMGRQLKAELDRIYGMPIPKIGGNGFDWDSVTISDLKKLHDGNAMRFSYILNMMLALEKTDSDEEEGF